MKKIGVIGSINMDMTVQAERIPLKGETLKGENLQYIPGGKGANQAVAMSRLGADVVMYVREVEKALLECEIVLLQHEIPQETIEYVIEFCYEHGIKAVLNPGPARPVKAEIIEKVTYLTPNEHEAVIIFGDGHSFEEMMRRYPEKLVITQGSRGVSTCSKDGEILLVPARKAKVVDTTGAGDTLNGAFTVAITEGKSMKDALVFANTAASLSTEKFGAQGGMPTYEEVEKAMEESGR